MNSLFAPFAAALSLCLAACGAGDAPKKSLADAPLAGASIGGPFTLVNGDGKTVTDRDFAGKYRIMYFGYTFCPDVCPVDVQNIGGAMKLLDKEKPALSASIVPVFVTIDPARDTPQVVKQFTSAFYPRMVGLTGSPAQVDAAAKVYRVPYQKRKTPSGYLMDHGRQAYLMGPNGEPIALLPQEQSPQAIVAEIERWIG
ncbi:SCO family protein [Sphingomonas turrisvirgatae]|uniref:Electron transporter n=1 Tax=Sphingomonas turrisvirgatae TaxID=1888892 RepID=A0A1E3LQR3_9SPHN|nr:SCO family protein [Sphingomonas turrisvirgatae]ODP36091.1 electron transporter [Sphingomonas turrisvirgatae]